VLIYFLNLCDSKFETKKKGYKMFRLFFALFVSFILASQANAAIKEELAVVNNTSENIWHLHVSREDISVWSEDKLKGIISPGDSHTFYFNDGTPNCYYDIIAYNMGRTKKWEKRNLNVCKIETWTLGN